MTHSDTSNPSDNLSPSAELALQITGFRADEIVLKYPIFLKGASTDAIQEKIEEIVKELFPAFDEMVINKLKEELPDLELMTIDKLNELAEKLETAAHAALYPPNPEDAQSERSNYAPAANSGKIEDPGFN